jgi:hypothetical protein
MLRSGGELLRCHLHQLCRRGVSCALQNVTPSCENARYVPEVSRATVENIVFAVKLSFYGRCSRESAQAVNCAHAQNGPRSTQVVDNPQYIGKQACIHCWWSTQNACLGLRLVRESAIWWTESRNDETVKLLDQSSLKLEGWIRAQYAAVVELLWNECLMYVRNNALKLAKSFFKIIQTQYIRGQKL